MTIVGVREGCVTLRFTELGDEIMLSPARARSIADLRETEGRTELVDELRRAAAAAELAARIVE